MVSCRTANETHLSGKHTLEYWLSWQEPRGAPQIGDALGHLNFPPRAQGPGWI